MSKSAVVLHWQGADRDLKPVAITNNHGLFLFSAVIPSHDIDPTSEVLLEDPSHARDFRCGEEVNEHIEELADVESAVGML